MSLTDENKDYEYAKDYLHGFPVGKIFYGF
jgi:hypothetical protein